MSENLGVEGTPSSTKKSIYARVGKLKFARFQISFICVVGRGVAHGIWSNSK